MAWNAHVISMTRPDPRLAFASRTKSEVCDEAVVDGSFLRWTGVLDWCESLVATMQHCPSHSVGGGFVGLGSVAGASGRDRP